MNSKSSTAKSGIGKLWPALALTAVAATVVLLSRLTGLENQAYDYFQQYQYKSASEQILLVTVDTRAGQYKDFWKGPQFGELVYRLNLLGARLIVATQPVNMPEVPSIEQILALEELQRQAQRSSGNDDPSDPLTKQVAAFRYKFDERAALATQ